MHKRPLAAQTQPEMCGCVDAKSIICLPACAAVFCYSLLVYPISQSDQHFAAMKQEVICVPCCCCLNLDCLLRVANVNSAARRQPGLKCTIRISSTHAMFEVTIPDVTFSFCTCGRQSACKSRRSGRRCGLKRGRSLAAYRNPFSSGQ